MNSNSLPRIEDVEPDVSPYGASSSTTTTHVLRANFTEADAGAEADVICPDCLNANRSARRRCRSIGGMCGGAGFVRKRVA